MARLRLATSAVAALALSTVASVVPLLALALLLGERVMPDDWTPLIGLALVTQLLGQGLMIYALGKLSPLVIGIALLIQPAVAVAVGWWVFDERLGSVELAGVALVGVALVLVCRPGRLASPPAQVG